MKKLIWLNLNHWNKRYCILVHDSETSQTNMKLIFSRPFLFLFSPAVLSPSLHFSPTLSPQLPLTHTSISFSLSHSFSLFTYMLTTAGAYTGRETVFCSWVISVVLEQSPIYHSPSSLLSWSHRPSLSELFSPPVPLMGSWSHSVCVCVCVCVWRGG